MIHHLVWFKLRDDIAPEDKEFLKLQLLGMVEEIPQIVEMACGEDFSGRSRGFEWGLLVKFQTREDGQIYDKHPVHQAFIARCKHLWSEVQALDFES
jgi:hypothetical protein